MKFLTPCNWAKPILLLFISIFAVVSIAPPAFCYPVKFVDSDGKNITVHKMPLRAVSLVPSVTEIICKLGAGDSLKAITYHSTYPPETAHKEIIGGFFSPNLERIAKLEPDIIFYTGLQGEVRGRFNQGKCQLVRLETGSLADSYRNIQLLGKIFNTQEKAEGLVREIRDKLELIEKKVKKIPQNRRKRVIRLMGQDQVMTPGDNSFQNEMIKAAGGIPPNLNKKGHIVPVTREEWLHFNPQIIYGCGGNKETAERFFNQPGWKDVEAVKAGKIFYFPCDLTCRAAANTGDFVSWLSARIYEDEFSKQEEQIIKDRVTAFRSLHIPLHYVKDSRIVYSRIRDFPNKTLLIDFKRPLSALSTLEGYRQGIQSVANHYSSPPCWALNHKLDLPGLRRFVYGVIGRSEEKSSILFTGADMDNLAVKQKRYKAVEVYALVTAGIKSNAVRMSKDKGRYYEPGTINILLLSNTKLTTRAMTRAIISATEAKTAALMDMDIRSSFTPMVNQATGTGTDNIIVVEGEGQKIDNTGGHTKMGELIASAVYEGVQEAVYKQNGVIAKRHIFQRLMDRKINTFGLISLDGCECHFKKSHLTRALEEILIQPRYASFIQSSLSISDDYERGLIADLSPFKLWCRELAGEIAGQEIDEMMDLVALDNLPIVVKMSLNALLNGLYYSMR